MKHITSINDRLYPTSLQGYVYTQYKTLVALFGEPNLNGDGYKTDAEWEFMTPYGVVTIYNYKDGKNYLGSEGSDVTEITEWHIGGVNKNAVPFIQSITEAYELK